MMMMMMDPHCHMVSRVTEDYEKMALCGIRVVVEPSFWLGEPRKRVGTFLDYFDHICNFERKRAAAYLIEHYAAISVNPRESNNSGLRDEVLAELPKWLDHETVVAVGEIGFDDITEAEEVSVRRQLQLAKERDLPVIVHTPHADKLRGVLRTLDVIREVGVSPERVVLDHTTEETVQVSKDSGCWCGFTVYNVTKLTPERAVNILEKYGPEKMLINSSCDWGPSDPLNVPRTALEMRRRGFSDDDIAKIVWENPMEFYRNTGRIKIK